MRLYDLPRSPWCQQVRIVLFEKGLAHERHIVLPGQELDTWYQQLNPLARVPTLVDREVVLREAAVIAEYLDEAYPDHPLMPPLAPQRAIVRMVVSFVEQYLGPPMEDLLDALDDTPAGPSPQPLAESLDALRADCTLAFALLAELLGEGLAFAASDTYSLADASLAPFLLELPGLLDLEDALLEQEQVASYRTRLMQRPSSRVVSQAWDEWREMSDQL